MLPILEALKDDADLYVRRSVANHVGDIAKDHPELAFELCERWVAGASNERKRLIRHAVRHPPRRASSWRDGGIYFARVMRTSGV